MIFLVVNQQFLLIWFLYQFFDLILFLFKLFGLNLLFSQFFGWILFLCQFFDLNFFLFNRILKIFYKTLKQFFFLVRFQTYDSMKSSFIGIYMMRSMLSLYQFQCIIIKSLWFFLFGQALTFIQV